ncbi:MAG: peptidylprolyl isomerase, partial [Bradyrhizobium sp.]
MISRSGLTARLAALTLATVLSCGTALAQGSAATAPAAADPVVARVNGQAIHLSDVKAAIAGLPANVRAMPPDQLYPKLLDSMVSAQALADAARKMGIDKDPAVQRQIESAANQVLDNALLSKVVLPAITDQALQARYQKEIAGKPGAEEVHARHILVDSEAQAKEIIAELNKGADFGALAKKYSKDPGAADGGDLGFFKRDEMVPAFADAAFALKPGQYT